MKIIEEFIDSLFSGVVETSETKQLKADLLANAEDRYEDLLSQGKSENEAIGTIISEFGTIDELMEELNLENKQLVLVLLQSWWVLACWLVCVVFFLTVLV